MRELRVTVNEDRTQFRIEEKLERVGWIYSPNPPEPKYFGTLEEAKQAIEQRKERQRIRENWTPVE